MPCFISLQEANSYFLFPSGETLLNAYLISTHIFAQMNRISISFGAAMCPVKTNYPRRHFVIESPTGYQRQSWLDPGAEDPQNKQCPCPAQLGRVS